MHSVAARTSYIKRFCKISTSSKARSKLRKAAGPLAVIVKKQISERMETKKGVKVPESLAKTLQESKELKNAWDKLRPSCQREYVERVNKAKSEEKRKEKIDRIIELTLDYAKRHPEKYKNRKSQDNGQSSWCSTPVWCGSWKFYLARLKAINRISGTIHRISK